MRPPPPLCGFGGEIFFPLQVLFLSLCGGSLFFHFTFLQFDAKVPIFLRVYFPRVFFSACGHFLFFLIELKNKLLPVRRTHKKDTLPKPFFGTLFLVFFPITPLSPRRSCILGVGFSDGFFQASSSLPCVFFNVSLT